VETGNVFDWNGERTPRAVALHDETLREAAQCPSAAPASQEDRAALLVAMSTLGVRSASLGFPAAGARERRDCALLARGVADARLPMSLSGAARALPADVAAVAAVAESAGVPIAAAVFLGLSPIRRRVEGWSLQALRAMLVGAFAECRTLGVEPLFVAEDATRTEPETLREMVGIAVDAGVRCVVIADTVGQATPDGAARIVRFVRDELLPGVDVRLEWHGHRDRGLAVANCLAAARAGADVVHGTALGLGERSGNAEMELLAANLHLGGAFDGDVTAAAGYVALAARAYGVAVPTRHPVFGADAFRTATGVHAAAVVKARSLGGAALADRVYSAMPAGDFGFVQRVGVSGASGAAAARWWLTEHGYAPDAALAARLVSAAKVAGRALHDDELRALCDGARA
jgi:isopropylmalate/homocitrate/citramalate synthase